MLGVFVVPYLSYFSSSRVFLTYLFIIFRTFPFDEKYIDIPKYSWTFLHATVIGSSLSCFYSVCCQSHQLTWSTRGILIVCPCTTVWWIVKHLCSYFKCICRMGLVQNPNPIVSQLDSSGIIKLPVGYHTVTVLTLCIWMVYHFCIWYFSYLFGSTCASIVSRVPVIQTHIISSISVLMSASVMSHVATSLFSLVLMFQDRNIYYVYIVGDLISS